MNRQTVVNQVGDMLALASIQFELREGVPAEPAVPIEIFDVDTPSRAIDPARIAGNPDRAADPLMLASEQVV